MFGRTRLEYKSDDQIRKMRLSGLVVASALAAAKQVAEAGATTADLNAAAHDVIVQAGATPTFLGYGNPPFTGSICTSVNSAVVHGIPGGQILAPGDLVSVDCGAMIDGWHGDSAISFVVPGDADPTLVARREALSQATYNSLWAGIAAVVVGNTLNDVGGAIEDAIDAHNAEQQEVEFAIVDGYTGHGIGSELHMPPEVLNYRVRERTPKIKTGLCIAIEPMVTTGSEETIVTDDQWTVLTDDGSDAAHWEHTVAVTSKGLWILTAEDGGVAELAALGLKAHPLDQDP